MPDSKSTPLGVHLEPTAALADDIANKIRLQGGDLASAYQAAEAGARAYQNLHGDLEQVLPTTEEIGEWPWFSGPRRWRVRSGLPSLAERIPEG